MNKNEFLMNILTSLYQDERLITFFIVAVYFYNVN
jgi:hypothetical protein